MLQSRVDRRTFLALPAGLVAAETLTCLQSAAAEREDHFGGTPRATTQSEEGVIYHRSTSDVMRGFPPPKERRVTVDNWWQSNANLRWIVQNGHRVLYRSRAIGRGDDEARPIPRRMIDLDQLKRIKVPWGEETLTVPQWLERSSTDLFVALHDGHIATEQYFGEMTPRDHHWAFCIAKTLTAIGIASLLHDGKIEEAAVVDRYVPEFEHTAFHGATVRQLLDMQTGVRFRYPDEVKNEPGSQAEREWTGGTPEFRRAQHENARFCRASGMTPQLPSEEGSGLYDFLLSHKDLDRPHGPPLHYAEVNTCALQLVAERVSGVPMHTMLEERIVRPLGFEQPLYMVNDTIGTLVGSIGAFITGRDLGRVGQMLLEDGRVDGKQVIPARYIEDIRNNARNNLIDEKTNLWGLFPPGTGYSSQTYVEPALSDPSPIIFAAGAWGQWLIVDKARQSVIVKLSSDTNYEHSLPDFIALRAFSEALAKAAS